MKHSKIKVAIADDHPVVIRGIKNMLEDHPELDIIQTFDSGKDVLSGLQTALPDVLLLDLMMPVMNGDVLLPLIVKTYPSLSVLILTNVAQPVTIHQMMELGALGYLLKSTDQQTLISAIKTVYHGKAFLDEQLKAPLADHVIREKRKLATTPKLSKREKEVLALIIEGLTNSEIAKRLFLGQRTVETYRYNLITKLGVKNTAALVKKALHENLF